MRSLVVGATGETGRFVVRFLLNKGLPVTVIVRSKERMLDLVKDCKSVDTLLTIVEGTVLDLSDEQLKREASQCDAMVSCLGHQLTISGMFGHPRRLVKDSVERLLDVASKPTTKFVLMGSDGVSQPGDDPRTGGERLILFLLRNLLPPHADNEAAAAFLSSQQYTQHWVGVRPTDLVDEGLPSSYVTYDKPVGGLFGSAIVSRANTARFMVDLLTDDKLFEEQKGKFPVVHNSLQNKTQG